jgi:hypothetical protein
MASYIASPSPRPTGASKDVEARRAAGAEAIDDAQRQPVVTAEKLGFDVTLAVHRIALVQDVDPDRRQVVTQRSPHGPGSLGDVAT